MIGRTASLGPVGLASALWRIPVFFLALLLLMSAFAACGGDDPTPRPTRDSAQPEATEAGATTVLPSQQSTGEPEGETSPGQTSAEPTMPIAEPSPTPRAAADAPARVRVLPTSTPQSTEAPGVQQDSPEADREVLITFYNATGGSNWGNNTNWLTDWPMDSWHGVATSGGRVVSISLASNRLTGELPPELGDLSHLEELLLADNRLTGSIPPELGNLTSLVAADLGRNQLTGDIPPEFANLKSLQMMDIASNQMTGCVPGGLEGIIFGGLSPCIAALATPTSTPIAAEQARPTPAPRPDPTAAPRPAGVHAATPMPTATPASTARPTGTPEEESSISAFPWYRDGLHGYEIQVAKGLLHIEREHPSTARTVLDLPWVVDGPNDNEDGVLAHFQFIPEEDSPLLQRLVGFPWFTDGLTEIEADVLILIVVINMEYSFQAERIAGFQWIADGISPNEKSFVLKIQNLLRDVGANASDNQYAAQRVLALPWLADDFTEHEYTLISQYLSWVVGWVDLELSDSVLESPLFDASDGEVKPLQAAAMTVVRSLIRRGRLEELLGQPWFQDGLTEEELALITVLTGRLDEEEVFQGFIKGGDVVHSETIALPFAGELKLFVISRFPLDPDSGIIEFTRSSVEHIEAAVGVPWPRDFIILVVEPTARVDVTHYFIISSTGLDSPIPHEFAHHYFSSGHVKKWLAEGTATFLERNPFSKSAEQNRSLYDAVKRGCASADGRITSGSASSRTTSRDQAITGRSSSGKNEYCEYTIGEAFWLGMYLSLGRDIVSTYLGELYKAGEANRAEVYHALADGQVYEVLLSNTPPEKLAQFRELWQRLYGRDMEVTHSGDRNALVAIVQANRRDPSWSGYANWLSDAPISQWENVVTNDSGRVISLDLSFSSLNMRVPPELANLSMLEELYLNRNDFTGTIPAELGNLSRLERLYLADTELTGCIPEGLRRVPQNDFDEAGLPFC